MGGRPEVEILEVFDIGATGGAMVTAPPPVPEAPRGRRRWAILAAAGTAALIAGALAWPAPQSASPPPAPSTVRPPAPATTGRTPPSGFGGFRLVPDAAPRGYDLRYADEFEPAVVGGITAIWRPVFARFGETGTWTMIQARREDPAADVQGDRRVMVGGEVGVLSDDLGVRSLTFPTGDGWTIQMWARVNDDEWLTGNAPFVHVVDGHISYPGGDGVHQSGYELEVADDDGGSLWAFGHRPASIAYEGADGQWLSAVISEPPSTERDALYDFLLYRRLTLVDGTPARFAQDLLPGPSSVALQFMRNDQLVTIVAPDLAAATALADSMHPGSEAQWRRLAATARPDARPGIEFAGNGTLLGSGELSGGAAWTATGNVDTSARHMFLQFDISPDPSSGILQSASFDSPDVPEVPTIRAVANRRATFVGALLPGAAGGAVLRVILDGSPSAIDTPLADASDRFPLAFAVTAFDATVDWRAEILSPDGTVLASTD